MKNTIDQSASILNLSDAKNVHVPHSKKAETQKAQEKNNLLGG